MTDHHHTDPVVLPRDTIVATPNAEPLYVYREVNGQQLIAVHITDNRIGDLQLLLAPELARHIGLHLLAMLDNLDALHAEWKDTHHD